nr:MAG TPA: hypothetical protein [Caudoviricetes sp.]
MWPGWTARKAPYIRGKPKQGTFRTLRTDSPPMPILPQGW